MAYTYSKIATYTVGSGGIPSVSFLNIPQTYTDLVVKFSARSTAASSDLVYIQPNGLTTNLTYRILYGQGTTAGSISGSDGLIGWIDISSDTANTFGNAEVYIPNYTYANYKSFSTYAVTENNDQQADKSFAASLWSSTAAITSLGFAPSSGSFVQYSTFHLYGIKAEL